MIDYNKHTELRRKADEIRQSLSFLPEGHPLDDIAILDSSTLIDENGVGVRIPLEDNGAFLGHLSIFNFEHRPIRNEIAGAYPALFVGENNLPIATEDDLLFIPPLD